MLAISRSITTSNFGRDRSKRIFSPVVWGKYSIEPIEPPRHAIEEWIAVLVIVSHGNNCVTNADLCLQIALSHVES